MLTNGQYILRQLTAFSLGVIAMPIAENFVSGYLYLLAFPIVYFTLNKGILLFQQSKRAKELRISRKEYLHIDEQLTKASKQAQALTQKYVQVRSVKSFRSIYDMSKLSKRIIAIVKQDPSKFYLIEDFFYAHLPSALELADKYALLTKEQVTGTDIHLALNDARNTLKGLHETMELDLKQALSNDIESLRLELDFAKITNTNRRPTSIEDQEK